jgi:hypothetical protein
MRGLDWINDSVGVLAVEPANSSLRAMDVSPHTYNSKRFNIPNWVAKLDSFPEARSGDDGYESDNSFLFYFEHKSKLNECGGFFTVGSKAQKLRQGHTFVDTSKYDDCEYLSALVVAALVEHYPNGHNNIVLGVTHPFSYNETYREKIRNSVIGSYKVQLRDGTKLKFVVKKVLSFAETEGSINFLSTKIRSLTMGLAVNEVRLIDWGHGTTHEIVFAIDKDNRIVPDYESARTYDLGGRNYMDILSQYIAINYKSDLGLIADRVEFDNRLFSAMDTGVYRPFGNIEIPVADVVRDIKQRAAYELRDMRDMRSYGTNRSDVVLFAGGGSRYFAHEATLTAFQRGFVWGQNAKLISEGDSLRFANLEGIRNQMLAMANEGRFTPNGS